jgi:hypothetical protein
MAVIRHDLLNSLQIATPCNVPWEGMAGGYAIRFCGKCRKNVYNVAAMRADEALGIIQQTEGSICLRLSRRPDGTLVTGDCWPYLRPRRRPGLVAFLAVLPFALAAQLLAMAVGVRTLASFFRGPPTSVAVKVEPPKPMPVPAPAIITLGGPPPVEQLDEIRAELRGDHPHRKHRR